MNCILLHGCPSTEEKALRRTYDKHWMPWIKQELEKRNIPTEIPLMPAPWKPDYLAFKKEFDKIKTITDNTILIGHSCGASFLVRWLGETKKKIKKLFLVAPWKIPWREDGTDIGFFTYTIDPTISTRVKKIIIFTADDEEKDGKTSVKLFHRALQGKIIKLKGKGHYTQEDMETEQFPELLHEILS
ncbi:MAG: alpha/beta hydrolase [Nanoarchaeota archaeon]|nr:alpha/beta hydrolase [Nanoarchaeota archaeon]